WSISLDAADVAARYLVQQYRERQDAALVCRTPLVVERTCRFATATQNCTLPHRQKCPHVETTAGIRSCARVNSSGQTRSVYAVDDRSARFFSPSASLARPARRFGPCGEPR